MADEPQEKVAEGTEKFEEGNDEVGRGEPGWQAYHKKDCC